MLIRIQKLLNFGRFVDIRNKAGITFAKYNFIFGRNTFGKSTFVSLFRSLQNNNNDIIVGRKTFGSTNVTIELDFDENGASKYTFQNNKWDKSNSNIEIFDSSFIQQNIHAGDIINTDHKKKINDLIIGSKGILLKKQINDFTTDINNIANEKASLTSSLRSEFPLKDYPTLNISEFCKLKIDDKAIGVLRNIEIGLDNYENIDVNKKILDDCIASLESAKIKNFVGVLDTSIVADVSLISDHIRNSWKDTTHSYNFLNEGLELTKDNWDKCVFCGQTHSVDSRKLLAAYNTYFKGEYKTLQDSIRIFQTKLEKFNVEFTLDKIKNDLEKKQLFVNIDYQKYFQTLSIKKGNLLELLDAKSRNVYEVFNSTSFDSFNSEIDNIINSLNQFRDKKLDDKEIAQNIQTLKNEIKYWKPITKRSSPFFDDLCKDFFALEAKTLDLQNKRGEIQFELSQHSKEIFEKYKDIINEILKGLNADFRLKELNQLEKLKGTEESIILEFFENYKIDISTSNDIIPNFKNSFSESDKRLLGFAFFMAKLYLDDNLAEKIVIFDDPFSSFDEDRKWKMVNYITTKWPSINMSGSVKIKEPKQLLIFTHEARFFRELSLKKLTGSTLTLEIIDIGVKNGIKCSTFDRCDVEERFPHDDIIKSIKNLKHIQDAQSYSVNFYDDCRIIMENILKRKYYFLLQSDITNRKGVRTFITTLEHQYSPQIFLDLISLCDALNIELHDTPIQPSEGDRETVLIDFFRLLSYL